jgi:hypothetical protein
VFRPVLVALVAASLSLAEGKETFIGVVTDDMCPLGNHGRMRMGPSDAACARACIGEHGGVYVLYDGRSAWMLSDQQTSGRFAGERVQVVGLLDKSTGTIQVETMTPAK